MRNKRPAVKAKLSLEQLDERIVPSALSPARIAASRAAIVSGDNGGSGRAGLRTARAERLANLRAARAERLAVQRAARAERLAGRSNPTIPNAVNFAVPAAPASPAGLNTVVFAQPTPVASPIGTVVNVFEPPPPFNPDPTVPPPTPPAPTSPIPTNDPTDVKNGPLAKAGQDLIAIYSDFQADGAVSATNAGRYRIVGNSVGVDIRVSGDLTVAADQMRALGMQVENFDAATRTLEGLLPIRQLPTAAASSQVVSMTVIYRLATNF